MYHFVITSTWWPEDVRSFVHREADFVSLEAPEFAEQFDNLPHEVRLIEKVRFGFEVISGSYQLWIFPPPHLVTKEEPKVIERGIITVPWYLEHPRYQLLEVLNKLFKVSS